MCGTKKKSSRKRRRRAHPQRKNQGGASKRHRHETRSSYPSTCVSFERVMTNINHLYRRVCASCCVWKEEAARRGLNARVPISTKTTTQNYIFLLCMNVVFMYTLMDIHLKMILSWHTTSQNIFPDASVSCDMRIFCIRVVHYFYFDDS